MQISNVLRRFSLSRAVLILVIAAFSAGCASTTKLTGYTPKAAPASAKDPANWPAAMRAEWGSDDGQAAAQEHRRRLMAGYGKITFTTQGIALLADCITCTLQRLG